MKSLKQMLEERPRAPLSVSPDDSVFSALELMAKHDIGAVLVMHEGKLAGIFSERDYARKVILLGKSSKETMVREIMTEKVSIGDLVKETISQQAFLIKQLEQYIAG